MYQILRVGRHADATEIKRAYRALARDLHPDTSTLPDAQIRFQILNDAYQILGDPLRRRLYNLQYDRYYEWLRQREAALAAQRAYEERLAEEASRAARNNARRTSQRSTPPPPVPPPPPSPPFFHQAESRSADPRQARQRTSHAEPYVSMRQVRQKLFVRYIPTVRTVAMLIWLFVGIQIADRAFTEVMEIEKVQASVMTSSQWNGTFKKVETAERFFREDIYGYVDLEPGDLIQFEQTRFLKRETEFLLIYTARERIEKKMGSIFANRVFFPWYIIVLFLAASSLAGYFLPDSMAELRFKFGLACIFFFALNLAVNLVF